jgi:hypothetical protein
MPKTRYTFLAGAQATVLVRIAHNELGTAKHGDGFWGRFMFIAGRKTRVPVDERDSRQHDLSLIYRTFELMRLWAGRNPNHSMTMPRRRCAVDDQPDAEPRLLHSAVYKNYVEHLETQEVTANMAFYVHKQENFFVRHSGALHLLSEFYSLAVQEQELK